MRGNRVVVLARGWLAVAVMLTGCFGCGANNPETCLLAPRTQAVVVPDKDTPRLKGDTSNNVALWKKKSGDSLSYADYVGLSPGVRVTIGDDPGFEEVTQEYIDNTARQEEERLKDAKTDKEIESCKEMLEFYKKQTPKNYFPPDRESGNRSISVVVESGERRGVAGNMRRKNLRPIKPE